MKTFKKSLFFFLYFSFSCYIMAFGQVGNTYQPSTLGYWIGKITQKEGGYRSVYDLKMDIKKVDGEYIARSLISVDDIFVVMKSTIDVKNGVFVIMKDIEILNEKSLEGLEWCFKNYQLIMKANGSLMEGFWHGKTKFTECIPGKVTLKKVSQKV